MKKNLKPIFATIAAFAVVFSCSKVEGPIDNGAQDGGTATSGLTTISATLTDALTKVAFTPSYGTDGKPASLALAWEAGDKLRVYNHADKTQYEDFELAAASVGQKTGQFTGTLPVAETYDVEIINGDVDYAAQIQPADGVTSSLKYLASASAVEDVTALTFTDYSSVLAITAKLPEGVAAVVGSVDITASEVIFNTGKTLTISLSAKGDAGNDGILHLFANLPQGNQQIPDGTALLLHFNAPDTDHTVYTRYVELGAQTFAAGKLNTINVNASQSDKHAGLAACDGTTSETAYLIGDKYQMQAMAGLLDADEKRYFELVDDIDLNGVAWTSLDAKVDFDGNGHTVSNLSGTGGLFATLDGSVTRLVLDAAVITPVADYAGILANIASDGTSVTFVDVTNSQITSTMSYNGGLVGQFNGGTIEDVDVACDVKGNQAIGGLIGYMTGGTLARCMASGKVNATGYFSGGLIAKMENGSLINCSASGMVENTRSSRYAHNGGLIGHMVNGMVESCYATGDAEALFPSCGGLIGTMDNGDVKKCYATGTSTGHSRLGGLIGTMYSGSVLNCYSTGEVQSKESGAAGGLVGYMPGGTVTIQESYADGKVMLLTVSQSFAGGLVGLVGSTDLTMLNCYATGEVSGGSGYCAGLLGRVESNNVNVKDCYTKTNLSTADNAQSGLFVTTKENIMIQYSGIIAWNTNDFVNFVYAITSSLTSAPEGNYFGNEGTISEQALKLNWSPDIWDLSKDSPTLKF